MRTQRNAYRFLTGVALSMAGAAWLLAGCAAQVDSDGAPADQQLTSDPWTALPGIGPERDEPDRRNARNPSEGPDVRVRTYRPDDGLAQLRRLQPPLRKR